MTISDTRCELCLSPSVVTVNSFGACPLHLSEVFASVVRLEMWRVGVSETEQETLYPIVLGELWEALSTQDTLTFELWRDTRPEPDE